MVEIDVYSVNKDFGFVEFEQTFVGQSMADAEKEYPGKILRIIGRINMPKKVVVDKALMDKQQQEFTAKLMLAAGSIKKGASK